MKDLNDEDWIVTEAKISVKQTVGIPYINKDYLLLIMFNAEYWRPLTEKEKETGSYPGNRYADQMDKIANSMNEVLLGTKDEKKKKKPKQLPEEIIVKELVSENKKVSKEIFNKYQPADKILVRYHRRNHRNFEIVDKDDLSSDLDLWRHLIK